MRDEQSQLDEEMDRKLEMQQDVYYEKKMYADEEFCFEQLADDAVQAIEDLRTSMSDHGHIMSSKQVLQELEELV